MSGIRLSAADIQVRQEVNSVVIRNHTRWIRVQRNCEYGLKGESVTVADLLGLSKPLAFHPATQESVVSSYAQSPIPRSSFRRLNTSTYVHCRLTSRGIFQRERDGTRSVSIEGSTGALSLLLRMRITFGKEVMAAALGPKLIPDPGTGDWRSGEDDHGGIELITCAQSIQPYYTQRE